MAADQTPLPLQPYWLLRVGALGIGAFPSEVSRFCPCQSGNTGSCKAHLSLEPRPQAGVLALILARNRQ
jgi:hypothetical protein